MGHFITCGCGQRNRVDGYQFGEEPVCVACGRPLRRRNDTEPTDPFPPSAPDFGESPGAAAVTGLFESPPPPDIAATPPTFSVEPPTFSVELPTFSVEPPPRAWAGRVRETTRDADAVEACTRCHRPFRGAWDRNPRPEGVLCHICATQATTEFMVASDSLYGALSRPTPPRAIRRDPDPDREERERKKRREMISLGVIAAATLLFVNIFPVEEWMALLFTVDRAEAAELPAVWVWVARVTQFTVSVVGQFITLYAALSWSGLLYEGGWDENWPTVVALSVVFAILNELVLLAFVMFQLFGPASRILIGMAASIAFIIKMLMIAERFSLRIENGVSFVLSWIACALMLWPCKFAINHLINGIISFIVF